MGDRCLFENAHELCVLANIAFANCGVTQILLQMETIFGTGCNNKHGMWYFKFASENGLPLRIFVVSVCLQRV